MQPIVLLGSLSLTPYSLMMTVGALLGLALTLFLERKKLGPDRVLSLFLCAVPAAMLAGHLVWCIPNIGRTDPYAEGFSILWRFWVGGYTLYGAILGAMLALFAYARVRKLPAGRLMDALIPGVCLVLFFGRAAEYFNGEGIGLLVEDEALQFFPFAVCTYADEYWQEWNWAVFAWESLAALILLAVTLLLRTKKLREGSLTEIFLVLLGASQILFEQARRDNCIAFHNDFIRLTQLLAVFAMAGVLIRRLIRDEASLWRWLRLAIFALGVTIVILVEFSFEKPRFWLWLRLCIGAAGALSVPALRELRTRRGLPLIQMICVPVCCAALIVLSLTVPDWEISLVPWLMMAGALALIAQTCLCQKNRAAA